MCITLIPHSIGHLIYVYIYLIVICITFMIQPLISLIRATRYLHSLSWNIFNPLPPPLMIPTIFCCRQTFRRRVPLLCSFMSLFNKFLPSNHSSYFSYKILHCKLKRDTTFFFLHSMVMGTRFTINMYISLHIFS